MTISASPAAGPCAAGLLVAAVALLAAAAPARAGQGPADRQGQRRRNPPERPRHRRGGSRPDPADAAGRQARLSGAVHGRPDPGVEGRRGQEGRRLAPNSSSKMAFERRKLLMSNLLQSVGKTALTDEAMHKVYDDAVKGIGRTAGSARAPHPDPRRCRRRQGQQGCRGQDQGGHRAPEQRRGFRQGGERSDRGSLRQGQWRRSRLFHQGPDGAGIRRRRLQARQGPDLRPGEDPVRLACHQGRGQAHEAAADLRRGQAADRAVRGAQGAGRSGHQAARRGQDREVLQAGGRAQEGRAEGRRAGRRSKSDQFIQ